MVNFLGRVLEAGSNVLGLEVRKVFEDFCLGHPRRQQVEHILHADAHASDARPPTALLGIEGDSIRVLHGDDLKAGRGLSQILLWWAASPDGSIGALR